MDGKTETNNDLVARLRKAMLEKLIAPDADGGVEGRVEDFPPDDVRLDGLFNLTELSRVAIALVLGDAANRLRAAGDGYANLAEIYARLGVNSDSRLALARADIAYDFAKIIEKPLSVPVAKGDAS